MKKYKVTQEFMDTLKEWNDSHKYQDGTTMINQYTINELPEDVTEWIFGIRTNVAEGNRRLGALINWINGEDVFEIGTPKYIVKRKGIVSIDVSKYLCITQKGNMITVSLYDHATRFDNFNEASGWANKHFEVVEVDE